MSTVDTKDDMNISEMPVEIMEKFCQELDTPSLLRLSESYNRISRVCSRVITQRKKDYLLDKLIGAWYLPAGEAKSAVFVVIRDNMVKVLQTLNIYTTEGDILPGMSEKAWFRFISIDLDDPEVLDILQLLYQELKDRKYIKANQGMQFINSSFDTLVRNNNLKF